MDYKPVGEFCSTPYCENLRRKGGRYCSACHAEHMRLTRQKRREARRDLLDALERAGLSSTTRGARREP